MPVRTRANAKRKRQEDKIRKRTTRQAKDNANVTDVPGEDSCEEPDYHGLHALESMTTFPTIDKLLGQPRPILQNLLIEVQDVLNRPGPTSSAYARLESVLLTNLSTDEVTPNHAADQEKEHDHSSPVEDYYEPEKEHSWWNTLKSSSVRPINHVWSRKCRHCSTELLTNETGSFCCNNGKYKLTPLPPMPEELDEVYMDETFSHQSRKLNSLFSFTSIGVDGHFVRFPGGVSSVVIQGRVYHRILPGQTENSPLRWILYDATEREHAAENLNLDCRMVAMITSVLNNINPFIHSLHRLRADTRENRALILDTNTAGEEIAAIMCIDNTTQISPRSVVIHYQTDNQPTFLNSLSAYYEPLQYPFLFPHGTIGWSPDSELSQIWFYRDRLLHEPRFNLAGRLVNEYLVDMLSRVEEERLNYIRHNQPAALDDEVVQAEGGPKAGNIYLPSSFLGGRRWCSEQTADALAIVAKYGKPSFFITLTTNPKWKEIQSRLKPDQNYADIPTVVVRAFRQRLVKFKKFLKKHFGRLVYCVSVVEFQKRGLPHAHLAVKVCPEPKSPEDIDCVVVAEIPKNNEKLKALVLKHMMHKHSTRCKKEDGSCQYKYPQKITPATTIDERGYAHYKRSTEEDLNVVPYNPHLLLLTECHINVEIASTVNLIMYLYKYLFKGGDSARFVITEGEEVDEIKDYIKGRYLSAMEATWRIFAFHISDKTPAVECLKLHLPQQQLHFTKKPVLSPLQRYFLRAKQEPFSSMIYTQYYDSCIFKAVNNAEITDEMILEEFSPGHVRYQIKFRQRGEKICRIQMFYPSAGELFYLRVLLLHKAGSSFEDLKTVDGVELPTFQEAAQKLGLVNHGEEGMNCMQEAVTQLHSPRQLRYLFCELILNGSPAVELYNKYYRNLLADIAERVPETEALDIMLSELANFLEERGKTMDDFALPNPVTRATEAELYRERYLNDMNHLGNQATRMYADMNAGQKKIYELVTSALNQAQPLLLFIDGRAGRGKTFLVQALCNYVRSLGKIILPCATTALAASNYVGGTTAHSLFRIPVEESNEQLRSNISPTSDRWTLLKQSSIVVWDEFAMINKAVFMCAEELMRCVMRSREPFGGKIFIALGDFRQNAPVVRGGGKTATILASVRTLAIWDKFQIQSLTERVRDAEDPEYSEFADSIGDGISGSTVEITLLPVTEDENYAVEFIYPDEILKKPEECLFRSILCTLNKNVDDFNQKIMRRLPGEEFVLHSVDSIKENGNVVENGQFASNEFLNSLKSPGIPDHTILLKVGCQCSIMKNLTKPLGLCKNIRVVVKSITRHFVEVETIGVNSQRCLLPRVEFFFKLPWSTWTVYRRQFPLRLAYACTYNSAIGLTLDKAIFDLRSEAFSHGQLYTGLTRIKGRKYGLILGKAENGSPFKTSNVVYKELLL